MEARQWTSGDGGGLWSPSPPACPTPSVPTLELFSDEPSSPAAAVLSFSAGSLTQLRSPVPLSAAAFLGYPQDIFEMFQGQELGQLTALADSKHSILTEADNPSSLSSPTTELTSQHVSSSVSTEPTEEKLTRPPQTDNINTESSGALKALRSSSTTLERPVDDGYNWRKYGQKAVKGGECPTSYYKCTQNCPVRKTVEHSADGHIIKITYRGQHSHERPTKRRSKDWGCLSNEFDYFNDNEDASARSLSECQGNYGKAIASNGAISGHLVAIKGEGDEQFSGSSDCQEEGDDEVRTVDGPDGHANAIERNAAGQKIIVSTTSKVDLLDDGYRWRKYGQKVVKGSPHPRRYYKCTYQGCDVKKQIERSSQEPHAVVTTYEGKHIHDVPASRNRSTQCGIVNTSGKIQLLDLSSRSSSPRLTPTWVSAHFGMGLQWIAD